MAFFNFIILTRHIDSQRLRYFNQFIMRLFKSLKSFKKKRKKEQFLCYTNNSKNKKARFILKKYKKPRRSR